MMSWDTGPLNHAIIPFGLGLVFEGGSIVAKLISVALGIKVIADCLYSKCLRILQICGWFKYSVLDLVHVNMSSS